MPGLKMSWVRGQTLRNRSRMRGRGRISDGGLGRRGRRGWEGGRLDGKLWMLWGGREKYVEDVEDVEDGLIDFPKAPLKQDYLTHKQ